MLIRRKVGLLKDSVKNTDHFYKDSDRPYHNIDLLVRRIFDYFGVIPQEFDRVKKLEQEINHFRNIKVTLKDISELAAKVDSVRKFEEPDSRREGAKEETGAERNRHRRIHGRALSGPPEWYERRRREYSGKRLKIRHVSNHYYLPLILSGETDRIDFIKHIIQEPSEIAFLNRLEEYVAKPGNRFKDFDWWMFSKVDETLDDVYIPYYDGTSNKIREFKPDFIFWLRKKGEYFIIFVDPKGTAHADYQQKIDGYKTIFEQANGAEKRFGYNGKSVIVFAFLYTADKDGLPAPYRRYWFDDVDKVLSSILGPERIESSY